MMEGKFSWYVMKLRGEPSKTFVIGGELFINYLSKFVFVASMYLVFSGVSNGSVSWLGGKTLGGTS